MLIVLKGLSFVGWGGGWLCFPPIFLAMHVNTETTQLQHNLGGAQETVTKCTEVQRPEGSLRYGTGAAQPHGADG